MAPATILNWDHQRVGSIPLVGNCGINGLNFSYDGRYCIHIGDNDLGRHAICITTCYVRKVSDWSSMYLGSIMYWPDIWIGASSNQVSAPQIKPDSVSFIDSVIVVLSCATDGAEIHYTTNGQAPSQSSPTYSSPIKITSTITIRAIAYKAGSDSSNVSEKTFVQTALRACETPFNTEPGLWYKYYEGTWSNMPTFGSLTPKDTGASANFSLTPKKTANNFAFLFYGYIDAPQDGVYRFTLESDDGSILLIGDSVVVNNDGVHTTAPKSGSIGLKAGKHPITVKYFDAGSAATLAVKYEMGGLVPQQAIPNGALFRKRNTPVPWVEIIAPIAGQNAGIGDTLPVKWVYHDGINHMVNVNLSIDGGKSYPFSLNGTNAYLMGAKEQGELRYVIPQDQGMVTDNARISISDYNNQGETGFSGVFKIVKSSPLRNFADPAYRRIPPPGSNGLMEVYSIDGRNVGRNSAAALKLKRKITGVYLVQLRDGALIWIRRLCAPQ
jgi:hypothetical protein